MSESYHFRGPNAPALRLSGADALPLLQRLSTNDVQQLADGQGCPTIFLNAGGRILERVFVQRVGDDALLFLAPGRDALLRPYLQRNIFFRDEVKIESEAPHFVFDCTGQLAREIVAQLPMAEFRAFCHHEGGNGQDLLTIYCPAERSEQLQNAIREIAPGICVGDEEQREWHRIILGLPAAGRELQPAFLPLELGLWREISFQKGCYIGQEIIARMESRQQLARLLVRLGSEDGPVAAGVALRCDGARVGEITSAARGPAGNWRALAVVKRSIALVDQPLNLEDSTARARIVAIAGQHPAWVFAEPVRRR